MKYIFFIIMFLIFIFCIFIGLVNFKNHDTHDLQKIINNQENEGWNILDKKGKLGEYTYYIMLSSDKASTLGAHWSIEGKAYKEQYKRSPGKEIKILTFQKKDGDKFCLILER